MLLLFAYQHWIYYVFYSWTGEIQDINKLIL